MTGSDPAHSLARSFRRGALRIVDIAGAEAELKCLTRFTKMGEHVRWHRDSDAVRTGYEAARLAYSSPGETGATTRLR
jgi:hypothetical protein